MKFEAEGGEFSKFLRSLEQFFLTVGQNNFVNKIPFFIRALNFPRKKLDLFVAIFAMIVEPESRE